MADKVRPGKKAFYLIIAAVAVSVIMAVSSFLSPDAAPGMEMVTAAPRSGLGGGSDLLPNCVRCGGTDCVIWLPEGAEVSEESVRGLYDGISWAVLTTGETSFTDSLREEVIGAAISSVPGTGREARVTYSAEGYVGRETVRYEEMRVREKVSLRTRDGYFFTYLLRAENGAGIVISASCDGSAAVAGTRELLYSIASSFQRGDEQDASVREAILREAKTGSVTGELDENLLYETDEGGGSETDGVETVLPDETFGGDDGLLVIDAPFEFAKKAKNGWVVVITWTNKSVSPTELYVETPSGEILSFDEGQSLDGTRVFFVTGDEEPSGWRLFGRTERQMGDTYPMLYSAEEYADAYWN